jgi:hypothetical protein
LLPGKPGLSGLEKAGIDVTAGSADDDALNDDALNDDALILLAPGTSA